MLVYETLLKAAEEQPDKVVLEFMGNKITYRALADEALRAAGGFRRLGIEPAAVVPVDKTISEYDLNSKSLLELPDTTAARTVDDLMDKLLQPA